MAKEKRVKAAALFSGGKDSTLALYKAIKEKKLDVRCLATILPAKEDSLLFHKPLKALLKEQAKQLGIKLIIQRSSVKDKGVELYDLKKLLDKVKRYDKDIKVIILGGIKSNFQGKRFNYVIKNKGFDVYAPLWSYAPEKLWKELLKRNFKIILTKIASEGISKELLGKIITRDRLKELEKLSKKYKFSLDFEGGDAETTVLYMPLFKKEIQLNYNIVSEDNYRHFLKLK